MESSLKGGIADQQYGRPRTEPQRPRVWPSPMRAEGACTRRGDGRQRMQRIVVAAKAGTEQPWLADAAASLAEQTGADVAVVSFDGLELEALSTLPRDELAKGAEEAARAVADRIARAGI